MSDAAKLPSTEWLEVYLSQKSGNQCDLKDHHYKIIMDFTLLWNLYESHLLKGTKDKKKRENLARGFSLPQPILHAVFSFFRNRYISTQDSSPAVPLSSLFEPNKGIKDQAILERFLSAPNGEGDMKQACHMIICRYRNNLFHGNKKLSQVWNESTIFVAACDFLMACLGEPESL